MLLSSPQASYLYVGGDIGIPYPSLVPPPCSTSIFYSLSRRRGWAQTHIPEREKEYHATHHVREENSNPSPRRERERANEAQREGGREKGENKVRPRRIVMLAAVACVCVALGLRRAASWQHPRYLWYGVPCAVQGRVLRPTHVLYGAYSAGSGGDLIT